MYTDTHDNFAYLLNIQRKDLTYDTREVKLIELVKGFKKNKKSITVGHPLSDYRLINNNIYMLLMRVQPESIFVIRDDYNFVAGYQELKFLYRWMFKGVPIITNDGCEYYYKKMPPSFKESFENQLVRIRIYSNDVPAHVFERCHYICPMRIGN